MHFPLKKDGQTVWVGRVRYKALRNSLHGLRLVCRMLFLPQTDQTALPTGVLEAQSKAAFPAQVLEDKEDLKNDRVL